MDEETGLPASHKQLYVCVIILVVRRVLGPEAERARPAEALAQMMHIVQCNCEQPATKCPTRRTFTQNCGKPTAPCSLLLIRQLLHSPSLAATKLPFHACCCWHCLLLLLLLLSRCCNHALDHCHLPSRQWLSSTG